KGEAKKAEKKEPTKAPAASQPAAARQTPAKHSEPLATAQPAQQAPISHAPTFKPKPSPRARAFAKNYLINLDDIKGSGGEHGRVTESDVKAYLQESGYFERKITPSAFNLAKKEGLTLLQIEASGEGGRITLADVKDAAKEKPKELSTMRKIIAKRLSDSKKNIPHFYVTVSIDMTKTQSLRKKMKEEGDTVSVNDFIIKAVALSLKEFPMMNAECDGNLTKYKSKVNVGIAVSLENGLVVPVVKNADKRALDEIHAEVAELAEAARNGKLPPDKMKGGTFTISNMGMLNVENFAAIINPGESAILAVSSSIPAPVVNDGKIEIREIMKVTVSADHRVVDGADAAKFANALKKRLENPESLL
ncbi:MAG TPA: dihydrolipoamide acetyltransferase family protein, partial [Victivallales bacterium]|nr:dihydrolipoamide acetyltransferase family protein [Victivallales bacterium]